MGLPELSLYPYGGQPYSEASAKAGKRSDQSDTFPDCSWHGLQVCALTPRTVECLGSGRGERDETSDADQVSALHAIDLRRPYLDQPAAGASQRSSAGQEEHLRGPS